MELIYKHKYMSDTMEEVNQALAVTEPELEELLLPHPFLSAQSEKMLCNFMTLALACNRLAAYEDAEIKITLEETTVTVLLTAPCFLFQIRQFMLWQKLCLFASEIAIDPNGEITVSFDFSKIDDKLYSYFEPQK